MKMQKKIRFERDWVASNDKWSVCVIASKQGSCYMNNIVNALIEYWKNEDYPITYLLLDEVIALYYKDDETFKSVIDDINENNTHAFDYVDVFSDDGNTPVEEDCYKEIRKDTWMFKFTYKQNYFREVNSKLTYFGRIMQDALRNHK